MILFCPRCGSEFGTDFKGEWWSTSTRCRQCGVALTEPPTELAPSEDETEYVLEAWTPMDRATVTAALFEAGFPYRWSADLVLSVPEAAEDEVNQVLGDLSEGPVILEVEERVIGEDDEEDALEGQAGGAASVGDDIDPIAAIDGAVVGADGPRAPEDADHADHGDEDDEDGGEEAHAAMESLFVAADRLQHSPSDATVVYDLVEASEVVAGSRPPYGIEREVWGRIQALAATAAEAGLGQADDEVVVADAKALRDFLRSYV